MASIEISREIKVDVNWPELVGKLTEVAAQGFLTIFGYDGVSSGVSALIGAASTVKIEDEPGRTIWSLTLLCFAWTLDELKSDGIADHEALRSALNAALLDAKAKVDAGGVTCPLTFLERPTTLPLYQTLRDSVIAHKSSFRSGAGETDQALIFRFDSAFSRSMFEILLKRQDIYQQLAPLFNLPGGRASEMELNWAAYRQRLMHDFEVRPVFGQEASKISLSQLYVPLRGVWKKRDDDNDEEVRANIYTHEIANLDGELDKWLDDANSDDWVRLIGGGPGSGKSTTLRAFAHRVAQRTDWRPLFVPLQHLDLNGNLKDTIASYFIERTNGAFSQSPISRECLEDGPPLLLIFDGLDEIARPGEAANEVVGLFAAKLHNLHTSLKGDSSKPVKVVVSGRMPSFQSAKRYLNPPKGGSIEVYGFTPLQNHRKKGSLWFVDQRPMWWKQYAKLVGARNEVPEAFSNKKLAGITHEPLLCYLLVLSGFATNNWEQAADNTNRIYSALLNSVWERGWGEGRRQGPGRSLSKNDFNSLMQTIALAAWQGGDTRVATEAAFTQAVSLAGAGQAWECFRMANGPDVTNLAMNFYMKSSETKQRGFEFTHKSFGDYLAARAILDFAEKLKVLIGLKVDHAMTDWLQATGPGKLSPEIRDFLRDEVRLRLSGSDIDIATQNVIESKKSFEKFISTILSEGLPAHIGLSSWRTGESLQRNAEAMAWAVVNSYSIGLASIGNDEKFVHIEWNKQTDILRRLIKRLTAFSDYDAVTRCFSYLVAPAAQMYGLNLSRADFRGAVMPGANFSGCQLLETNFSGADLTAATFNRAMMDHSNLSNSNLSNSVLVDTRLNIANIDGANLDNAQITFDTLINADLDALEPFSERLIHRQMIPRDTAEKSLQRSLEQIERAEEIFQNVKKVSMVEPSDGRRAK